MTSLSKICFNKTTSNIDFATGEYLVNFLEILRAKSLLPINKMLSTIFSKEADTVSCSRDDTNYSFFASKNRNGISIVIKQLGEETIDFCIPETKLKELKCFS